MQWQDDEGVEVTAAFEGITTPARDLYDEIHKRGWTVSKVDIKDGQYVATGQNPYHEKIEKTGPTDATALGNLLIAIMRRETIRYQSKTAAWTQTFDDRISEIAHAYAEAPVYDPKAAGAWKELADDQRGRAEAIAQQIDVEVTNDPAPYKDMAEMAEDVRKKRHITVTRAHSEHPVWTTDQVLAYRLVRDVLGHCVAGGDYGWHGETRATSAIMPLLNPIAQKAYFTESLGNAAFSIYYRAFSPQKIVFLDEVIGDAQEKENEGAHSGIHPGTTVVPGEVPDISEPKESAVNSEATDPNAGWDSNLMPLPDNAYLWIREQNGLDPIDWQGAKEHAEALDTGWAQHVQPDGSPDYDTQRQAVVNAFRSVLMGPRKADRWHATHYQHIAPIPARVSDPQRFWETLENNRNHHNMARGMPANIHRALWEPEAQQFASWIKGLDPKLHDGQAEERARREIFHMMSEEEERITQEDPDRKLTAQDIEAEVHKAMAKRLKTLVKPNVNEKTDFPEHTANLMNQPDPGVYGSFLASHVKPVAAVGLHADDLLKAARDDVANNRGRGHHFRKEALSLGIPGIGPREASFAWMLLQPHTSQLAVINPHIAEILGEKPEDINNRDYFRMERQLAAGRDLAGYSHVPLGQFGWAMHDYKRGGPGHHEDLGYLRALHPTPYDQIDWYNKPPLGDGRWQDPYWWQATQEGRDQVHDAWGEDVASKTPSHEIPFQKTASQQSGMSYLKTVHPDLTTEEIWAQYPEDIEQTV